MIRRRTAIAIASVIAGATVAAVVTGQLLARRATRGGAVVAPTPEPTIRIARWVVEIAGRAPVPDRVVHAPVVVGERVIVAGARVGYVALDTATGGLAWRRAAGPELAAPLVLSPHDVILVHACDQAIGVADGRAVVACFERIDPIDIAARQAGAIHAAVDAVAPCLASMSPWRVRGDAAALVIERDGCALAVTLSDGTATAVTATAPPTPTAPAAECGITASGVAWCQRVGGGASSVELAGARVPGLSALAALTRGDTTAAVIRADATLLHDHVALISRGAVAWTWELPPPAAPRATPVAISFDRGGVYVMFDSTRVAAVDL
jgi:hypothetical protein